VDNRWFRKSSTQMKEVYKGKKIMIVAGGPSTNDVAWENLDYDYLWTCNYFYQNEKLKDRKVDLALLGNTVNFSNEDLKNKLNKDDSIVVIEPTHIRKTNTEEYLNFESEFKSNIFKFDAGYRNMDGVGIRLTILALSFEASEVYLVGHDGYSKDMKAVHAFQGHDGLQPGATHTDWNKWHESILHSFRTIHELALENKVKLYNLGEGHEKNIGTEVSSKLFPLPQQIKSKL